MEYQEFICRKEKGYKWQVASDKWQVVSGKWQVEEETPWGVSEKYIY